MKFKKSHVGILFTLVIGYFLVYFATHSIEVYVPTSSPNAESGLVIVIDAGHGAFSSYRKMPYNMATFYK